MRSIFSCPEWQLLLLDRVQRLAGRNSQDERVTAQQRLTVHLERALTVTVSTQKSSPTVISPGALVVAATPQREA
jgi:hypothetical protein